MTRHILSVIMVAVVVCACGAEKTLSPSHAPRAVQVQQWPGSDTLGRNKRIIVDTATKRGCSRERVALLIAMACLETQEITCEERDMSKDGDGTSPSRNYSAWNMNRDFLQYVGVDMSTVEDLNQNSHLSRATDIMITALDQLGEDQCLSFHRGGRSAFVDGVSYGAREYKEAIHCTQSAILGNFDLSTNNTRIGCNVPHV